MSSSRWSTSRGLGCLRFSRWLRMVCGMKSVPRSQSQDLPHCRHHLASILPQRLKPKNVRTPPQAASSDGNGSYSTYRCAIDCSTSALPSRPCRSFAQMYLGWKIGWRKEPACGWYPLPTGTRWGSGTQTYTKGALRKTWIGNLLGKALDRDEVVCPVDLRDLDMRLTALFRKVRNDLAEGGSNTLYLAVGFLRWKQNPTDEKTYRAPLLLVPVKLTRRSASSPFYLANHEDEVRFNATLLQMLKKDFDCDLTAFESDLPTDDSGVNVPLVLDRMRLGVRDIPGFEVIEEAAIAPFSFAKYLMWKDLVDRIGQLKQNRVVHHLIHEPDKAFEIDGAGPMPQPHEIDTRYVPSEIVHPLPADSSQLAAVMAASEGHDMVIVGPPGTGKSQTIANLIAQCLAVGKTVLFVAEKTAALDVVHRRLRQHGLGDCCVELHSNKAERRRFLDQLETSWKNRGKEDASDWVTISNELRVRRDQLNAYAAAVHQPDANGWTAYCAMGECVRGRQIDTPILSWPANVRHDVPEYAEIQATIAKLASTFQAVPADSAMPRVESTEWSMSWETRLLESCRQLVAASESLTSSIEAISKILETPSLADVSATQLSQLYRLAQELARPCLPSPELLLSDRLDELKAALAQRRDLLLNSHEANAALRSRAY